jgi:hypothetical protein
MTDGERFVDVLFFFSISFAVAFGLAAASIMSFTGKSKAWSAARTFASGGAVGGAFMALALKAVIDFEHQLRSHPRWPYWGLSSGCHAWRSFCSYPHRCRIIEKNQKAVSTGQDAPPQTRAGRRAAR